jgi:small subunit ribosomal protein S3
MGQKIHPTGFRLAVSRNWASRWYASNKDFAGMLAEDIKVREYLKAKLKNAAVSRVLIERPAKSARITIFSARPGVVIGKKRRRHRVAQERTRCSSGRARRGQHRRSAQA